MPSCPQCGAALKDGVRFCTGCGRPVLLDTASSAPERAEPLRQSGPSNQAPSVSPSAEPSSPPPPQYTPPRQQTHTAAPPAYSVEGWSSGGPAPGSRYELSSTGGFIGILLLMCIPLVGLILMSVWACGGCRKLQKRNLARASLILAVIGLALSLVLGFAFRGVIGRMSAEGIGGTAGAAQSLGLGALLSGSPAGGGAAEDQGGTGTPGVLSGLVGVFSGHAGTEAEDGSSSGTGDLAGLPEAVDQMNQDASAKAGGWPGGLRAYPGGAAVSVETYRTQVTGTTREEMRSYIEALKKDGFAFQDFYELGFTEADMLELNGWWGTDGTLYLSLSYYDGTVTIDHMTELPDLEDYFN